MDIMQWCVFHLIDFLVGGLIYNILFAPRIATNFDRCVFYQYGSHVIVDRVHMVHRLRVSRSAHTSDFKCLASTFISGVLIDIVVDRVKVKFTNWIWLGDSFHLLFLSWPMSIFTYGTSY